MMITQLRFFTVLTILSFMSAHGSYYVDPHAPARTGHEEASPLTIRNNSGREIWVRVKVFSVVGGLREEISMQILHLVPGQTSEPILRHRYHWFSMSLWADAECTIALCPSRIWGGAAVWAGVDAVSIEPARGSYQVLMHHDFRGMPCSICLEEVVAEDRVLALPCGHKLHERCGLEALRRNPICPLCRQPVRPDTCMTYNAEMTVPLYLGPEDRPH